jgi:outer membrane protein TolC
LNARALAALPLVAALSLSPLASRAAPRSAAAAPSPSAAPAAPISAALEPIPPAAEPPAPEGPPLTLAEALARAKDASPDLSVARERVIQSQNNLSRAWSAFQPTLTANGSYTRNSYESGFPFGNTVLVTQPANQLQGNLTGQIMLFNARAFPALDTAKDQIEINKLGETQLRRETLLNVAATYLLGLQQKELLSAAFRRSQASRDQLRQAQSRYEAGLLQKAAAVRAQLDAVSADQEARRQTFALQATKSQLATLLDRHDTAFELAAAPDLTVEQKGSFQELLKKALAERPEVASQKLSEQITARVRSDAWAQFWPTVNLNGVVRANNSDLFPGQDRLTWAVTLAVSLPLYDGGFRYTQLKDAASQERQAAAQTRTTTIRIEDELRRALLDLETARVLRDTSAQSLKVAQENERLARAQFEAGTSTQIEVSDAEASLYQAEAAALQQKLAVQLSALRLAKAVGAFEP